MGLKSLYENKQFSPHWNVVKPDGAADWSIQFGVSLLFPE
jgi:hypothetical protein